jgi:hypothetical protein
MSSGLCPACGKLRQLTAAGELVAHHYSIGVSRKAVKAAGGGRVKRRCPGSGRAPRRVER